MQSRDLGSRQSCAPWENLDLGHVGQERLTVENRASLIGSHPPSSAVEPPEPVGQGTKPPPPRPRNPRPQLLAQPTPPTGSVAVPPEHFHNFPLVSSAGRQLSSLGLKSCTSTRALLLLPEPSQTSDKSLPPELQDQKLILDVLTQFVNYLNVFLIRRVMCVLFCTKHLKKK